MDRLVRYIKSGNVAEFNKEAKSAGENFNWDTPTNGGWTCLHYAAYMGSVQIVTELLNT